MKIKYLIPTAEPKDRTEDTIFLDNSFGDSIFKKYNKGIHLIEDCDAIVFMHDDAKILDPLFEKKVEIVFNHFPSVAIIGVVGTKVFNANGGWWTCDRRTETVGHWMQGHPDGSVTHNVDKIGFSKDIVSVDGCCFIGRSELFKNGTLKFDAKYDGYHFYDADICIQAKDKGYDVAVADILIQHESEGPLNESWFKNKQMFIDKWTEKGYSFPLTVKSFGGSNEQVRRGNC
jgi:GT2 family glycosyltransferase